MEAGSCSEETETVLTESVHHRQKRRRSDYYSKQKSRRAEENFAQVKVFFVHFKPPEESFGDV